MYHSVSPLPELPAAEEIMYEDFDYGCRRSF